MLIKSQKIIIENLSIQSKITEKIKGKINKNNEMKLLMKMDELDMDSLIEQIESKMNLLQLSSILVPPIIFVTIKNLLIFLLVMYSTTI